MIEIGQPYKFLEIGRKDNQEDYLYPERADRHTRVFILCDGMGGHDNGEVASMTAAESLGNSLSEHQEVSARIFDEALSKAYDALDGIDTHSERKPGTTMAALCLNDNNYLVAHIGDSRIYHIRPSNFNPDTGNGGILYQSSDHSLVNDLLKAGEISEEEARDFPRKNIITRAMQPHLERRCKADLYEFNDVAPGDYFFMCSDGVLEQLSNSQLCCILAASDITDHQKLDKIKSVCHGKTRDNFSCWLIPVEKVRLKNTAGTHSNVICATEEISPSPAVEGERIKRPCLHTGSVKQPQVRTIKKKGNIKDEFQSSSFLNLLLICLAALVVAIIIIWLLI